MTAPTGTPLHRLVALAGELRRELEAAVAAGWTDRADQLGGELALLDDLALPEAVGELHLQRIAYTAADEATARVLTPALRRFLA